MTYPSILPPPPRFTVWMAIPGVKGWTCVARNVTEEQAMAYHDTCLHQTNIEESKKEE